MNLTIYVAAGGRHKQAVQRLQAALAEQAGAQILDWTDKAAMPPDLNPAQRRAWYDAGQTGGHVFLFCVDACANADLVIYYGAPGGEAPEDAGHAPPLSEIDAGVEVGLAAGAGVPVLGIRGPLEVPGLLLYGVVGLWVRDITDAVDAVRTITACDAFPRACVDCRLRPVCPLFGVAKEDMFLRPGRVCRVCGCDDFHACPGGCYWVEDDLCSACASKGDDHDPR